MEYTPHEVECITQDVIEKYQKFVNPTQVALLQRRLAAEAAK